LEDKANEWMAKKVQSKNCNWTKRNEKTFKRKSNLPIIKHNYVTSDREDKPIFCGPDKAMLLAYGFCLISYKDLVSDFKWRGTRVIQKLQCMIWKAF